MAAEKKSDGSLIIYGNPIFHGEVQCKTINHYQKQSPTASPVDSQYTPATEEDLIVKELTVDETYDNHLGEHDKYQITKFRKGQVLLINNEFKGSAKNRKGSEKDVTNMVQLWQGIGCGVQVEKNFTAQRIQNRVEEFVHSRTVGNADFCVVIVMSHGKTGDLIIGDCGTKVAVERLVTTVRECENLRGKPKLLFFQMCRGVLAEKTTVDAADFDTSESTWFIEMLTTLLPRHLRVEAEATSVDLSGEKHLDGSEDMMIAFGTREEHVSFRDRKFGSWFISAIATVFAEHAKDKDLKELMNMVKDAVKKKVSHIPERGEYDRCTATVEAADTFRGKRLFFFPGYPKPM